MQNFHEWLKEAKVMILPLRKLEKMGMLDKLPPEAEHGAYLDADKFNFKNPNFEKAILNGKFFNSGSIGAGYVDPEGKRFPPQFHAHQPNLKIKSLIELKKPGKVLIKINMITNLTETNKKWHLFKPKRLPKDYYQITSIATSKEHFFCLNLNFNTPFLLANYPGGEPRNRPTTYGTINFGTKIATILLNGRKRDLFESITIN
jgi:hypothetical protein